MKMQSLIINVLLVSWLLCSFMTCILMCRSSLFWDVRCAVAVDEGSFRLSVLSGGPPFPYSIGFSLTTRKGSGTWCFPCDLLLRPFFCLLWTWVLPFCSLYLTFFFACFGLFMIGPGGHHSRAFICLALDGFSSPPFFNIQGFFFFYTVKIKLGF
jgi:hypothetical protein